MAAVAASLVSFAVAAVFVVEAVRDARTSMVVVVHARIVTALALIGLGSIGVLDRNWVGLVGAVLGALLVTLIQLVPYKLQQRKGRPMIGRADVRLGIPFGWTLGYFGLSFVFMGFALALLSGLGFCFVSRRERIPFIPFLAFGLVGGLLWALAV